MEIIYYITFSIFVTVTTYGLPIPEENAGEQTPLVLLKKPFDRSTEEESVAHIRTKQEISQDSVKLNDLEDSSDNSSKVKTKDHAEVLEVADNSLKVNTKDHGEVLEVAEARNPNYRPFFRFRKITRTRNTQPRYPLSNYANDRDRFPTTF